MIKNKKPSNKSSIAHSRKKVWGKNSHRIKLDEAAAFAATLAKTLRGGEIIALVGPLGAGKTTFTKALGKSLGVKRSITSPTFILSQEFRTAKKTRDGLLGLEEFWGRPETITAIEWADKITPLLPKDTIVLNFV
jgi:tRNA threonylcarbamoyladenosine biosynthesis protein TsaE